MSAAKAALQQAVKASAAVVDAVRPPASGVVVLIYHRVGAGSGLDVDLPIERFDEQMAWLAATGRVATLGEALSDLRAPGTEDSKIVVTFDDGTADFVERALPVLVRHQIPATLYAATAFIDEGRPFPPSAPAVSWAALRDACTTGLIDVGSHTHRHQLLDRLPSGEVAEELDRSITLIGEHLGRAAQDFAYPKALLGSLAAQQAVQQRFRSAALAGTRPNRYGATDPFRLARSPVQVSDKQRWFVRKAGGGMAFEDELRRVLNRRRYAAATT
jgi:peptidoglycan/xylan/chitin deacetylase (PgdA/CDA1 family)